MEISVELSLKVWPYQTALQSDEKKTHTEQSLKKETSEKGNLEKKYGLYKW